MVFALKDWFSYKAKRGPYSDSSLKAEGAQLATREAFPDAYRFQTGDLLFLHTRGSVLSWLVMYYTSSVWSHTAVFSDHGHIIDSTLDGVIEHPFEDYLDDSTYMIVRTYKTPLTAEQKTKLLTFARRQVGGRYNWRGVYRLLAAIALGIHAHYRFKFSADILIVLGCVSLLGFVVPTIGFVAFIFGGVYVLTVLCTTPLRRSMRARASPATRFPKPGESPTTRSAPT